MGVGGGGEMSAERRGDALPPERGQDTDGGEFADGGWSPVNRQDGRRSPWPRIRRLRWRQGRPAALPGLRDIEAHDADMQVELPTTLPPGASMTRPLPATTATQRVLPPHRVREHNYDYGSKSSAWYRRRRNGNRLFGLATDYMASRRTYSDSRRRIGR